MSKLLQLPGVERSKRVTLECCDGMGGAMRTGGHTKRSSSHPRKSKQLRVEVALIVVKNCKGKKRCLADDE